MKTNKAIQKISPFALGIVVCSYQIAQMPLVYGASLKNVSANADPLLKPIVPELQSFPSSAAAGCVSAPVGGGSTLPTSGTGTPLNVSNPSVLGESVASSVLASSVTGAVVPSTIVAQTSGLEPSANLIAQVPALDDCCAIGGTTTCEVGGVPPVGGAALAAGGLSPLLGLLGAPLLAIPALLGGGGGGSDPTPTPPVPEPSSTAAVTAALGMFGLWYGRRFRASQKTSS
jgi:hypothetical protein